MKARLMVLTVNATIAFLAAAPHIKWGPTWTDGS